MYELSLIDSFLNYFCISKKMSFNKILYTIPQKICSIYDSVLTVFATKTIQFLDNI